MSDLHIPNLTIKNFRGIDHLEIPRFGNFTLLVGRNGIGKTTILDAIRLFGFSGSIEAINRYLMARDEISETQAGAVATIGDLPALFESDDVSKVVRISSQSETIRHVLSIQVVHLDNGSVPAFPAEFGADAIRTTVNGKSRDVRIQLADADRKRFPNGMPPTVELSNDSNHDIPLTLDGSPFRFTSIGTNTMESPAVAMTWDKISMQPRDEKFVRGMLESLIGHSIDRIGTSSRNAIVEHMIDQRVTDRRVMVKLTDYAKPVPLKRLGEGAARLFALAVAMADIRNGVLLIDEFENGLHYSAHADVWHTLFTAASNAGVQIIATTHSADCVHAFATAATPSDDDDRLLLRLSRKTGDLRVVEYAGEKLQSVAKHGIEAR